MNALQLLFLLKIALILLQLCPNLLARFYIAATAPCPNLLGLLLSRYLILLRISRNLLGSLLSRCLIRLQLSRNLLGWLLSRCLILLRLHNLLGLLLSLCDFVATSLPRFHLTATFSPLRSSTYSRNENLWLQAT
ncbi:hypothetical protein PGT21_015244 [Puccinia graminis f. sp. tritici]|uniref:Uncharacterized protein n=1 Tax=Puccinia graminis f. sp. tritici TaxID=56615 RepID=A0A5B0MLM4_PUCGR|nr:hypothetical protein PGT21_015244 [Puccinia graminis f. sp. tritici]